MLDNKYSNCPSNHKICKDCFLSIIQICHCRIDSGEFVYKCPLCRNEHIFSNKEMNNILMKLTNTNTVYVQAHKKCERKNVTKKCQFENCGCRINILDVIVPEEIDLTIKSVIEIANKYKKINHG